MCWLSLCVSLPQKRGRAGEQDLMLDPRARKGPGMMEPRWMPCQEGSSLGPGVASEAPDSCWNILPPAGLRLLSGAWGWPPKPLTPAGTFCLLPA